MSLDFRDSAGNIFNRIGKMGLIIKQLRSYQTSQRNNLVGNDPPTGGTASLVGQFINEPDIQALVGNDYIGQLNSPGSIGSSMQFLAAEILNRMIYRDNPRINQTLTSSNVLGSLYELIRQMKLGGSAKFRGHGSRTSVWTHPTGGNNPAFLNPNFSPPGNGAIITSTVRPFDGLTLQYAFAETLKLECTSDSFLGGSIAGNETFLVTGRGQQLDPFAFDWPLGSGTSTSLSVIDGSKNNSSGNLLNNSSFDSWTGNTPDKFTVVVGTPGTHINKETNIVMQGGASLRITGGAGDPLTEIRQEFNSASGTTSSLEPLTQYSFNIYVRRDGSNNPATGTAVIDLIDANGTVIRDANNIANSTSIDLTSLSNPLVYSPYGIMFRTPMSLPPRYFWRLRTSVALPSTPTPRSVYFDLGGLGEATQLYTQGDYIAIHAGSLPFRLGDYTHVVVSNGRGVGGTLDTFLTLMQRLFYNEVMSNELIFPYDNTNPNISDTTLIA